MKTTALVLPAAALAAGIVLAAQPAAPGTTVSLGGLSFKSSKAQNFFGGGESFGIDVEGDLTKLASIEIVDGGKPLKSNGRMQMAAVTYLFPTPSSDTVTLKVSVREGNSRHTVKF